MSYWSQFSRAICLPNNCGCEFVDIHAWIAQPSAFWSSFFHVIIAYVFYRTIPRKDQKTTLWFFSLYLLAVGSLFGHGSFLEVAMATDFAGIILVTSYFALYNLIANYKFSTLKLLFFLIIYFLFLTYSFYSLEKWTKVSICISLVAFAMAELIKEYGLSLFKNNQLRIAFSSLLLSFVFFIFDELKIFCDPNSWLTGHSVWHFGTAVSLNFYGKFRLEKI